MADAPIFLRVTRSAATERPAEERVRDHRHVYHPVPPSRLATQASRCMDCGVPFCSAGCPLGNTIPDWNDLVRRDEWRVAFQRLMLTNNFPEFTGLLCPAPCETACVLDIGHEAVAIKDIELGIVNRAFEEGWIVPHPPEHRTDRRVAVVGSGPAGLAAAQQLNRLGHRVTVFEQDRRIGGLLRYGIPDFKIEKWVVDRRVDLLAREGILFETRCHAGTNPDAQTLRREFDAVLLAVGALQGRDLSVPGRELAGIHPAMDYLVARNRHVAGDPPGGIATISAAGKRVVVVGGGDTSADCLGNAHREGAAEVIIVTHGMQPPARRGPHTWPDWPSILRTYPSHKEGGQRHWNLAVTGFSGTDGAVRRVHLVETANHQGAFRPVPGTERTLDTDLVLLAIGFDGPVPGPLLDDLGVRIGPDGAVLADGSYRAGPGLYVAGDARRGASLIVWAIAEGRAAARSVAHALTEKHATV